MATPDQQPTTSTEDGNVQRSTAARFSKNSDASWKRLPPECVEDVGSSRGGKDGGKTQSRRYAWFRINRSTQGLNARGNARTFSTLALVLGGAESTFSLCSFFIAIKLLTAAAAAMV